MNSNTRDALKRLADAIQKLAFSVSSSVGTSALTEVMEASEKLKKSLDKDETIP